MIVRCLRVQWIEVPFYLLIIAKQYNTIMLIGGVAGASLTIAKNFYSKPHKQVALWSWNIPLSP